jgi:hypothetical protein
MSKNSPKQTYQASQEWLLWAKTKYKTLKKKKQKPTFPIFTEYNG